ncbi:hypothetical protein D3C87_1017530 [compost metagenome]
MNVNNNKRGNMGKRAKAAWIWVTNRLDKWIKVKTIKVGNIEGDMKPLGYGLMAIAFAMVFNAGANIYIAGKGVPIHQNVEINIIKKEEPKS